MASYRCKFRAFLLTFLFIFVIFVISTLQVLYKTSADYDDADDYIWQEEDEGYNEDSNNKVNQGNIEKDVHPQQEEDKEDGGYGKDSKINQGYIEKDVQQHEEDTEDERYDEDPSDNMNQDHIDKHAPPQHAEEIDQHLNPEDALSEDIHYPIIMWWYGFTHEKGRARSCGNVKCFFTSDRHYFSHPMMKVFMMYGTSFDVHDLPFPRKPHHEWGLLHEESPKNVYLFSHPEMVELYNLTATFKRESHFPLTLIWLDGLKNIETTEYLLPVGEKTRHQQESGLALAAYVHSDCGCPSDRDHFVDIMQKYIKVDSYGSCKHNKDLPANLTDALKSMDKPEFYRILAKYKFIITAENGVCDDYITEKFWRTFEVGSVPIFIGSKKIRDFLPDNHSAIIVDDFKSMKDLVKLMLYLNDNDDEYNKYLRYKQTGVTNKYLLNLIESRTWGRRHQPYYSFVTATECFICEKIHENIEREKNGLKPLPHLAKVEHYGCPKPLKFSGILPNDLERVEDDWHATEWINTFWRAKAIKQLWAEGNYNVTEREISGRASQLRHQAR